MSTRLLLLPPVTPAELLLHVVHHHAHPTTIVIASPRQPFLDALAIEVGQLGQHAGDILPKTLLQTAVSRHIRLVFCPTTTHLRAYLATFTPGWPAGIAPAPPGPSPTCYHTGSESGDDPSRRPPTLLVYAFLEIHRMTNEWSAQGISTTAATLVEAAVRSGFTAAILEPRGGGAAADGTGGFDTLDEFLHEEVPLLNGARRRDDTGDWVGRTVAVSRILGRWFKAEHPDNDTATTDQHQQSPSPAVKSEASRSSPSRLQGEQSN